MTLAAVFNYQIYARRVSLFALAACLVAVVCYGVLLLITVERAAEKQQYQSEVQDTNQTLAALESQYLAESAALTPDKAAELGLTPVPVSRIAYQGTQAPALSMRQ